MLNDQCRIELRKGGVHMFTRVVRTVGVLLLAVAHVKAQSLMYRPPNLGGTWVPEGGVVQFNFVHRFYVAPAVGGHKVTNFPTFTVAAGLGARLALGLHYGSNSFISLTPYHPNETKIYTHYHLKQPKNADEFAVA